MKNKGGFNCFVAVLIWLFISINLPAQPTLGLAEIINFSHEATRGGTQNWQVAQGPNGILYFANNAGLLTYNGRDWKLFALPNKTMVRSLSLSSNGRIYVGGQDEIGYFAPTNNGGLTYYSLLPVIPSQHHSFGDVWNIIHTGDYLFCRTSRSIFRISIKNQQMADVYIAPNGSRWAFMGMHGSRLIAQNGNENMVLFAQNKWQKMNLPALNNTVVTAAVDYGKDTTLIITMRNGLYLLSDMRAVPFPVKNEVKEAQIYSATATANGRFALGTVNGGIYFINKKGDVVSQYSTDNGLQNNNVRALLANDGYNLWAALDEGVALIQFNSPIQRITPTLKGRTATYASLVYNNRLLVGTSTGLYEAIIDSFKTPDFSQSQSLFTKVPHIDGQVWSLNLLHNKVLIGHHDGAFEYHSASARYITRLGGGYWLYRAARRQGSYIAGTYQGLQQLIATAKGFQSDSSFNNLLKETLRFVEIDEINNTIWASHPNRGVYMFTMSKDFQKVTSVSLLTDKHGLPSFKNNYVFRINQTIVICTEEGIYEYDTLNKVCRPSKMYQQLLGKISIKYLTQDSNNRMWFATDKTVGYFKDQKVHFIQEIEDLLVPGFEHIYPYNDQNIFIGSTNGILHINLEKYARQTSKLQVSFSKITAGSNNDSLLFDGFQAADSKGNISFAQPPQLSAKINSFRFEFTSNQYNPTAKVQYQYKLEGFDTEWSTWSEKKEKDYTNLPHGKYRFLLKGKDVANNESAIVAYSFDVPPHWHQTVWAKIFYAILAIGLAIALTKIHQYRIAKQKQKFEKEEAQLKYLHELELEHSEKEIIKLQKEQLEAEMQFKNKELAAATMHLYKRGKLLNKIKEDLLLATRALQDTGEKKDFIKLLKLIAEEEKRDGDWEQFAIHFDTVHNKFLQRIKKTYPTLTPTDLKMCAYMKMNLSTKEIAQLMNITIKGVEVSKYRLRKKLSLSQDNSLTAFINDFS
ncbi:transcriptional regulator [Phnomibacter ginsenosidimutans]|uniref:Transcriptional regulator n=2 Tax=Phnomibacter ginsenosidimutans TaxID=2676868 RepID=A0A6I6GP31_9BACT|nr:transcriptional regulator [Phnomibacter ginsenosidimutans]